MKRLGCYFGFHEWSRWQPRDNEGIPLPGGWLSRHCHICKTERWKPIPGSRLDQAIQATGPVVDSDQVSSDQDEPPGGVDVGDSGCDDSGIFQVDPEGK